MKTKQNNNMIDRTSMVYIENDIEWSKPIRSGVVFDKNLIRQWHD